jgi:hypothetical protein
MAAVTLLTLDAYLRPSEALSLHREMLIPPQAALSSAYRYWSILAHPWHYGQASKTGGFDDSIVLDSSWRPAVRACAEWLFRETQPGCKIAPFSHVEWQHKVTLCGDTLNIGQLHLYTLRRSGPSEDHVRHKRSLQEIQRRGRWLSEHSVRRYEKSARLLAQMKNWPLALRRHLQWCEDNLLDVFEGRVAAPSYAGVLTSSLPQKRTRKRKNRRVERRVSGKP